MCGRSCCLALTCGGLPELAVWPQAQAAAAAPVLMATAAPALKDLPAAMYDNVRRGKTCAHVPKYPTLAFVQQVRPR